MQENKNQRNGLEMCTPNQASPTDGSLYRIKTIPLDGPNKGIPTYQSVYRDPMVPALRDQLGWAEAENKRLRVELDRYKASGKIVNTTYTIALDPKSERCGVKVYRVKLDEEFREICDDEIDHLQRLLRSQSSGCVGKVFLDDMTAYFAKEYLSLSREETVAKIRLAGDAVDSATAWIRTVRELLQVFERNVTKIRLVYPPSDWYGAKIRQLASSMNLKEYGMFFVCNAGEIFTDTCVYSELKRHEKFSDPLSQLQLDWQFALMLLCGFPHLLAKPAGYLTAFMSEAADSGKERIRQTVRTFLAGMSPAETDVSPAKEVSPLDERSCDVLEFCLENGAEGVSAKAMRDHFNESSKSRFSKTILNPLCKRGCLEFACTDAHSSNQHYRITQEGITVLRQMRPGRTYPEPIRTDSKTNPAVPEGKTSDPDMAETTDPAGRNSMI